MVDLAGEVAIAGSGPAQRNAVNVDNRIVVHQVQTNRIAASTDIDGYRVGCAAAADAGNGSAGDVVGGKDEVSGVHTGHALTESDCEVDGGSRRWVIRIGAHNG